MSIYVELYFYSIYVDLRSKTMRQKSISFIAVLLGLVAVACGQHSEQPKPGPEAKKLAYFIGTWQGKAEVKPSMFGPGGGVERSEGTLAGDTWTWNASYDINGKTVKARTIIKPTSATSYDFTWEIAANGDDWTTVQQGTAKKAK